MTNYWIASTPLENFKIAKKDLLWACKSSFKNSFSRLKPGDKLTFYIFGKKVSGDFEIISEAFSSKNNFKGGSFPINIRIKEVKKTKISNFTPELIKKLVFVLLCHTYYYEKYLYLWVVLKFPMSSTSFLNKFPKETSIRNLDIQICRLIASDKKQKDIAKILNISKGYVSKRIKLLIKVGLLTPGPRSSTTTYSVNTSLLVEVSSNLTECEAPLKSNEYLIDCHNYKYKFRIVKDNPDVIGIKKGKMKNWERDPDYGDSGACEWRRTTKHVEFWLTTPVVIKTNDPQDLERLKATNLVLILKAASEFQRKHDMILDLTKPDPVHKEIKVKNALLTKLTKGKNIHDTIFKSVYPEDGTPEFKDEIYVKNYIGSRSVENKASSIIKRLDQLENNLLNCMEKQTTILEKLIPSPQTPAPKQVKKQDDFNPMIR